MIDTMNLRLVSLDDSEVGLRVIGELDLSTVHQFRSALAELPADGLVKLDMSEVTFLDSSGLHAIASYAGSLDGGGPLVLESPSEIAGRALAILGLPDHPKLEIRRNSDGE